MPTPQEYYTYSTFCCYEVHHSPLLACGEGVGGGVHVPHSIKIYLFTDLLHILGDGCSLEQLLLSLLLLRER